MVLMIYTIGFFCGKYQKMRALTIQLSSANCNISCIFMNDSKNEKVRVLDELEFDVELVSLLTILGSDNFRVSFTVAISIIKMLL